MADAIEQVEQVKKARKPAGYCACGAPLHTRAAPLGKCAACRKAERKQAAVIAPSDLEPDAA